MCVCVNEREFPLILNEKISINGNNFGSVMWNNVSLYFHSCMLLNTHIYVHMDFFPDRAHLLTKVNWYYYNTSNKIPTYVFTNVLTNEK